MGQQTKENLKLRFLTGEKPAQMDYHDWMDSYVHKTEVAAINANTMDERINNYDQALKEMTVGMVDTLGDLLHIMRGFDTAADVKELLQAANGAVSWGSIEGIPATKNLSWEEQVINVDLYYDTTYTNIESVPARSIVRGIGQYGAAQRVILLDIAVTNVPVQWINGPTGYIVHRIRAVTVGVGPKIGLR